MNLQENIHRIKQMMGVIKESEEQQPDYAVIEITKPLSYLSMKNYYQIVPYKDTLRDKIYINKGASGGKSISTKNINVLKTFNGGSNNPEMKDYLNNLRDTQ